MKPVSPQWQNARKVLCVRLDTMGDVLMTTPAIRAIKENLPGSQISLLTSSAGAEVARFVPEIDDIIIYQAPWMKPALDHASSQPDHALMAEILTHQYDAAVIFTVYSQSPLPAALFCYLADIPLRLAYCRENPYHLLTTWEKEIEPKQAIRHEVQRQLDLVAAIGWGTTNEHLSFAVREDMRAEAGRQLRATGVDLNRPWVAVHPGTTAPSRQYRPEGYAQAARVLVEDDGLQIVFTGSEEEKEIITRIQTGMGAPSFSLAGRLSVGSLGALLEMAPLLIANNTGPVHLAAALGTPVVDLYALTNPQHTPWAVPYRLLFHDVPCKFCYKSICPEGHHNCLRLVEPQEIVQAVRELLAEAPTSFDNQEVKPA